MKLGISEPEPRESGPILVYDEDNNDIAYFFHNEHATVGQSYETALMLARRLVGETACSTCNGTGEIDEREGRISAIESPRSLPGLFPAITLAKRMLEDETPR